MKLLSRRTVIASTGALLIAGLSQKTLARGEIDWADIVTATSKSLVLIEVERTGEENSQIPIRHGSGFVVDTSGLLMTNSHVVAGANKLRARFTDGSFFTVILVDDQPLIDLAVLRIISPPANLRALKFADFNRARAGHPVIALGSPLSYPFSVTSGIVSAFDRAYSDQDAIFLMQHDAALNPGNSGGPLLATSGEVLGVNTASPPETEYDIGIGLAVPSNIAASYLSAIRQRGRYEHSSLGVRVRSIGATLASVLNVPTKSGLLVEKVLPESAAANGLLQVGDLITSAGDKPLQEAFELARALWRLAPGTALALEVRRGTQKLKLEVTTERSSAHAISRRPPMQRFEKARGQASTSPNFGMSLKDQRLAGEASVVMITAVTPNSPAHLAGLAPGDVILQINQAPPPDAAAATAAIGDTRLASLLLLVSRPGAEQQFVVLSRDNRGQPPVEGFGALL